MNAKEEIQKCIEIMNAGGIILYPTDTIWGLGCDATNEMSIQKIFELKQRNESKSMITLVSSDGMLQRYIEEVPELAWDIMDLATKPTTIIYNGPRGIAKNAVADDNSLGIRMVKEGFCNQLVHRYNKPIISTSANISGEPSPTDFEEISEAIKNNVDHIVSPNHDTGNRKASSIIKLGVNGEVKVIRT